MIRCPHCKQVESINRAGIVRGKQRYFCKACQVHFSFPNEVHTPSLRPHQVTIVDIAEQLGISKSTVSRALRGQSDIHPGTRQAVLDVANQLDYQPNQLAHSLVKSRTNTVGMLVPEFLSSFFPKVIMSAQQVLVEAGYNVVICQSGESYETEVANARTLLANRVDGLMVSHTKETRNFDHLRTFQRKGIPVVFFNRVCEDMTVPNVTVDDYRGAFVAVEHLIQTGRRRIAHLAGPDSLPNSRNRLNGYHDALLHYGLPVDNELIISYDLTLEKVNIYVNHLLNLPHPPDALFAMNDPAAIEALRVCRSRGIRVPAELAIVGFSDDPVSELVEPSLTTVAQPMAEIGRETARLLLNALHGPVSDVPEQVMLPTQLIVRRSS
ncbi:LacI family DNA-binding transcriptional regulator [Spirosoma montaniterrae]|uniref:LacI family transcriptional regulator n=1 Tax=Spirosoma montaniterrae TaxID=1178516 RepID=A0A1P9X2Z1_9BACT|nr:substrate-binding domain-containing protein [Spirosoma montaniterrae]AQG81973.1 LacI family transcriptional regulator [Spirosoma montaniterrae]